MTIILGIDPGSRITGYGVIQEKNGHCKYIDSGCIRTNLKLTLSHKLMDIFNGVCELLEQYNPDEAAIEQIFMHQNPNSALKLGHARGAAMVALASHRLSIFEYSARYIKQAIVGYGGADKQQLKFRVLA